MKRTILNPKLPLPYNRMSAEDLDAETAKFDMELIAEEGVPLLPGQKAELRRARHKPGRPRIGKGAKRILVTVERDLLRRTDAFARKQRISRAQLIARGLETILAAAR